MAESRQYLLELLQGDSGSQYAISNNGWDDATDVCEWNGIMCTNGQVTIIDVNDAGLEGTIPLSLGSIPSLTHLYTASNKFQGSLPKEVLSLPNLQVVDLSLNQLNGTLPSFTSTAMQTLDLGHNRFEGTLPPNTGDGMNNLEVFDIKYNLVTGTIPSLAGGLPALRELDLSNNHLFGKIPGSLGQVTTLQRLFLSNNRLSGTIPVELTRAELKIEEIYLHGNLLSGTLPAALADLPKLVVLFIDDNKLTGTVPQELCDEDLNEAFFDDLDDENVDQTYDDLYGTNRRLRNRSANGRRRLSSRRLREGDPTETRDGCTSIACPAGYQSRGDNNKDGVFPCEKCESDHLNPYIGSNKCFEINQDVVLQIFHNATNGKAWAGGQNWVDAGVPTCQKEGVSCNDNGDVTSIVLPDLGLSGSLPAELGFLSHLTTLDVKRNKISGKLPAELRFAPLELLDVAENSISGYVPLGLCQEAGINGNGKDGIFTCDTIACGPESASPIGRAEAGADGIKCIPCDANTMYLGSIACARGSTTSSSSGALTPFGLVGEITIAVLALAFFFVLCWVYKRSAISSDYIKSIYAASVNQQDDDYENPVTKVVDDPLDGMDGTAAFPADLEVKTKAEWKSERESVEKTVWLDVPKIS